MKFLRAFVSLFRRPARSRAAYEEEVLFAGWVNLPPRFRELKDQVPPAPSTTRAITG